MFLVGSKQASKQVRMATLGCLFFQTSREGAGRYRDPTPTIICCASAESRILISLPLLVSDRLSIPDNLDPSSRSQGGTSNYHFAGANLSNTPSEYQSTTCNISTTIRRRLRLTDIKLSFRFAATEGPQTVTLRESTVKDRLVLTLLSETSMMSSQAIGSDF
ncbi:hypothetical protein BJ508DRAFT_64770 [Ascobolus immersus RN42]|uniref:Uncharacterized protein n=1 Tax=Ascobolus immersus RN42 TaxID=1160509 RepID=A0A3N4IPX9_ASCIM|nr:hypothetical protein BJ508DRAFT_64770 [Ascobolus immersus RN42]